MVDAAWNRFFDRRNCAVFLTVPLGVSGVALLGWIVGRPVLAGFSAHYIPMAPATALCFLVLAGSALLLSLRRESAWARLAAVFAAGPPILASSAILIRFFTGFGVDIEWPLFPHLVRAGEVLIGRMSPLTAALFLPAALALLFLGLPGEGRRVSRLAGGLSAAVILLAAAVLLGYLYGTPLLYGGTVIPMALPTALSFLFLGACLAVMTRDSWPFSAFTGSSVGSRLLRVFLPTTLAIVLLGNWLMAVIEEQTANPALVSAVAAVASLGVVVAVISRLSHTIGGEVDRTEARLRISIREKEALLREIHHRVKNNLQIISSLIRLQAESRVDGELEEMCRVSQSRIRSMALIHENLYRSTELDRVDIASYFENLAVHLIHTYGIDPDIVRLTIDAGNVSLDMDTAIPCGMIVTELVSNSLKYAFPSGRKGEIVIRLTEERRGYSLTIGDNGIGFPPGAERQKGGTLGLHLVDSLVGQLGGALTVDSTGGVRFSIALPRRNEGSTGA